MIYTICPVCYEKIPLVNNLVTYWMKRLGKRPMCRKCRAEFHVKKIKEGNREKV